MSTQSSSFERKTTSELSQAVEGNGEGMGQEDEASQSWTLSNFLYRKNILDEHVRRLKEIYATPSRVEVVQNGQRPQKRSKSKRRKLWLKAFAMITNT